jgi:deoxyadenosine/deoxycytidine kinase
MNNVRIGVVGPCAAGKSTLVTQLRSKGYTAIHIAQDHSYVKDMWKRITDPDVLVYLDVTYEQTIKRKNISWTEKEYDIQINRLEHACKFADLRIQTDKLSADEVLIIVLNFIKRSRFSCL